MLIAGGFALALESWPVAVALAVGFAIIYIPVIAGEERFLRATFPGFDEYCRLVPRILPRLTPAQLADQKDIVESTGPVTSTSKGRFSLELYRKHREYNAAIGAVLLYFCLLFLRPALAVLVHGTR
jgi:hypothetical protein